MIKKYETIGVGPLAHSYLVGIGDRKRNFIFSVGKMIAISQALYESVLFGEE